ncbi:MAG TPA: hypothetical protein VJ896_13170 [Bacteroidales bacterium]|nr:hypothetical protein [Bacteroidales bacterium]
MEIFKSGFYYHIYNRGVNSCNLYEESSNYVHFLRLYEKYILPVADTYAYCLMPNHFHFLIRIKEDKEIGYYKNLNADRSNDSVRFQTNPEKNEDLSESEVPDIVNTQKRPNPSRHFSHLFNAYSKYFNKRYTRTGPLFERLFKRILIENESYLKYLVYYIHHNPVKHGFVEDMTEYPWSSYLTVSSPKKTNLKRNQVIEWFDDLQNLKYFHKKTHDLDRIKDLI